jgi:NAD(P)H dehydrogenase (quinone)
MNILIAFYSRTGNVARLAEAVAQGARQTDGADIKLRRLDDLAPEEVIERDERWWRSREDQHARYPEPTLEDLEWADAIIFGTPTRYGNMSAELKLFIDKTGPLWVQGKLVNKVGAAFTSTATLHGGNEMTLHTIFIPMMHLGMIVVTPGYADPAMFAAGSPYGASSVSGPNADQSPTEADLAAARFLGHRVAAVTAALQRGGIGVGMSVHG